MKVLKFGGSCLKDSEDFFRVVKIVRSENKPFILVVSAIYGITDLLIDCLVFSMKNFNNITSIIEKIEKKHHKIVTECINSEIIKQRTLRELGNKIKAVERVLFRVAAIKEINNSIKALILSYGERLSSITLASILESHGIDSIAMESDKIGIITDTSFENATAILPAVRTNLQRALNPILNKGCVPIVTGYFGCTVSGKITTFGRNGSDYSAAVVAHGIGAKSLEIWKDVEGFMSADPKLIENVQMIDVLSYYEAAELSYFGAQILHPRTLEPLVDDGVEIRIRNIYEPTNKATLILPNGYTKNNVIKGVTYNKNISVLKIRGPGVGYKLGIIGDIGKKLSEVGINIYSAITAQTCINLLIDIKDAKKSYEVLQKCSGGIIENIDIEKDRALVGVVGEGLLKTKGLAARIFTAVAEQDVNVEMISAGASDVAYYFIVNERDLEIAIHAIHNNFFNEVKCKEM